MASPHPLQTTPAATTTAPLATEASPIVTTGGAALATEAVVTAVDAVSSTEAKLFFQACEAGDVKAVAEYLKKNKLFLSLVTSYGFTPMMAAIHKGQLAVVKLLKEQGADVNARVTMEGFKNATALFIALAHTKWNIVEYLLASGADMTVVFEGNDKAWSPYLGTNALWILAKFGRWNLLDQYLKKGLPNLDVTPRAESSELRGVTALWTAAVEPRGWNIAEKLLDCGANPNLGPLCGENQNMTPLMKLAAMDRWDQVKKLLMTKKIVDCPKRMSEKTSQLQTALRYAQNSCSEQADEIETLLIGQGAISRDKEMQEDLLSESNQKRFFELCKAGNTRLIKRLVGQESGLLNITNPGGLTPLMEVAERKQIAMVKLLIELGANVNARSESKAMKNATALFLCSARYGGMDKDIQATAECLLAAGADMSIVFEGESGDFSDYRGTNAIWTLARCCRFSLLHKYLKSGTPNLDVIMPLSSSYQWLRGTTAFWLVCDSYNSYNDEGAMLAEKLYSLGADPNLRPPGRETALLCLARKTQWPLIEELLSTAKIQHLDSDESQSMSVRGKTALWYAREYGADRIQALLISQGASLDIALPTPTPLPKPAKPIPHGAPLLYRYMEDEVQDTKNFCLLSEEDRKAAIDIFSEKPKFIKSKSKRPALKILFIVDNEKELERTVIKTDDGSLYVLGKKLGESACEVLVAQNLSTLELHACKHFKYPTENFYRPETIKRILAGIGVEKKYLAETVKQKVHSLEIACDDFQGDMYYTQDLVLGKNLDNFISKCRSKCPEAFIKSYYERLIIAQLLAEDLYVNYHQHNRIHRDLKPDNVMYHRELNEAVVRIIDNGCVHQLTSDTETLGIAGFEGCRSPEVAKSGLYSQASDIYALGKIYKELLPQEYCHDDRTRVEVERLIQGMLLENRLGRPDIEMVINKLKDILYFANALTSSSKDSIVSNGYAKRKP